MNELSLYILDLAQNAVAAGAARVIIHIDMRAREGEMAIAIKDDGRGMDEAFQERVVSPFHTTRTTRKVGLGIPMAKQLCEDCGGRFHLASAPGVGTSLTLRLARAHIDLPPMGDLAATIQTLVIGSPDVPEFTLRYRAKGAFEFDTAQIKAALDGVSLNTPEVANWIYGYVSEGIEAADTGREQNDSEVL